MSYLSKRTYYNNLQLHIIIELKSFHDSWFERLLVYLILGLGAAFQLLKQVVLAKHFLKLSTYSRMKFELLANIDPLHILTSSGS